MKWLWLLLSIGTGCVSFSTMQRADVLEKGQTRVGFAPIAFQENRRLEDSLAMPFVASARHGLANDLELGTRFWLIGAGVGLKYQVFDRDPFVLSVAPEVAAFVHDDLDETAFDVTLPVLAGINFDGHQVVFGPSVVVRNWQIRSDGERSVTVFPGVLAGIDFVLPGGVHLMPEASLTSWGGGREWFWTTTLGIYLEPGTEDEPEPL